MSAVKKLLRQANAAGEQYPPSQSEQRQKPPSRSQVDHGYDSKSMKSDNNAINNKYSGE